MSNVDSNCDDLPDHVPTLQRGFNLSYCNNYFEIWINNNLTASGRNHQAAINNILRNGLCYDELTEKNKNMLKILRSSIKKIDTYMRNKRNRRARKIDQILSNNTTLYKYVDIIGEYISKPSNKLSQIKQSTQLPRQLVDIILDY